MFMLIRTMFALGVWEAVKIQGPSVSFHVFLLRIHLAHSHVCFWFSCLPKFSPWPRWTHEFGYSYHDMSLGPWMLSEAQWFVTISWVSVENLTKEKFKNNCDNLKKLMLNSPSLSMVELAPWLPRKLFSKLSLPERSVCSFLHEFG